MKILLFIVLIYFAFRYIWKPYQLKSAISGIFGGADVTSISLEKKDIFEVASISQPVVVQYSGTKGIWPVKSSLVVQGIFDAKFGFDLKQDFPISVDPSTLEVTVLLAPPKLLSIEQKGHKVLGENQSIWSSFTAAEQTEALNDLLAYAKQVATSPEVLRAATTAFETRIAEIARGLGGSAKITIEHLPEVKLRGES